jgi:hypothetical protein
MGGIEMKAFADAILWDYLEGHKMSIGSRKNGRPERENAWPDRLRAFIWAIILTSIFWSWTMQKYYTFWAVETHAPLQSQTSRGEDFGIYYAHVTGTGTPDQERGWLYPEHAKVELAWLGWFPRPVSYGIWSAVMIGSYLLLIHKLLRIADGWILALVTLKPFLLVIVSGNIGTALALLCVWPWGMVLATSIKCYCGGFIVLFAASRTLWTRNTQSVHRLGYDGLCGDGLGDLPASIGPATEEFAYHGLHLRSDTAMGEILGHRKAGDHQSNKQFEPRPHPASSNESRMASKPTPSSAHEKGRRTDESGLIWKKDVQRKTG